MRRPGVPAGHALGDRRRHPIVTTLGREPHSQGSRRAPTGFLGTSWLGPRRRPCTASLNVANAQRTVPD
ncbi:hypothetical protein [Ornithinimicrobium kibberense]|uniref:hypothetical protein n=1 Tax=Ornithinimicrobium kibberense TaxID=282060 RepID=UPI0036208F02